MKVVSLNIGRAKMVDWQGKTLPTGIYKQSTPDTYKVSLTGIETDVQADLKHHGGINKAVYAYDISHYAYWKTVLKRNDWPYGLFGENLTTDGLTDGMVCVGDCYQIGSTVLQAIQPRFPCFKLNIRFDLPDMLQQFMAAKRNGIYFKVIQEGTIYAGADIKLVEQSPYNITIQDMIDCYVNKGADEQQLADILAIPFLPDSLRKSYTSFED